MKKHLISFLAVLLAVVLALTSCGGDSELVADLESQIEDLQSELDEVKEENALKDQEIDKLKEENSEKDKEIGNLKDDNSSKDEEINNLKAEIKKLQDEIAALESKDAENLAKIAKLEADYAAKVAELEAEHKAEVEALETENANLALQIEELEAEIQELITSGYFCTATFNVNGGEGEIAPQVVGINKTFNQPESPVKNGYEFIGWCVNGEEVEFPYIATTDVEFVAKYTPVTYTITYNVNSGTMPEAYTAEYNVETGVTLPLPTRSLYLFDGWYEDAKFEGAKVTLIPVGEVGNRTYYAKWISTTNGIIYQLSNDGTYYTVTGYEGNDTVVVIPGSIDGILVTAIADNAFKDKQRITSITIPNSIASVGESAFRGCISLTELNLGNGIMAIPYRMADGCDALQSIVIPDSVTSIGSGAFWGCDSLANVVIPNSVSSVGSYAFEYCSSLTSIVIPDSVTSIGTYTFRYCSGLTSVVMGDSITSIGSYAFYDCDNLVRVHINDLANWCNISFSDKHSNPLCYAHNLYLGGELVTKLVIPDSVTTISKWAFYSCSPLANVVIPNSVTSIGDSAFQYCYNIYVVYNNSNLLVEIGSENNGCLADYARILVENGKNIYVYGGYECALTEDDFLFRKNGSKYELIAYMGEKETITLPESINGNSYDICSVYGAINVIVPRSFTKINDYAFSWCNNLSSIVIPDSVTIIGLNAFENCDSLTNITIPDSVITVNSSAFWQCSYLTSVVIGNSIASIGERAFYECDSLANIYYNGTEEEWTKISIGFDNDPLKNATRYYYSETEPTEEGNFWHWVDGEVVVWE